MVLFKNFMKSSIIESFFDNFLPVVIPLSLIFFKELKLFIFHELFLFLYQFFELLT
jgi:hypothetical protein